MDGRGRSISKIPTASRSNIAVSRAAARRVTRRCTEHLRFRAPHWNSPTHSSKRDRPATEPKWRFDDDQDRALLLWLAARGSDRRADVCGGVSLHGVPTAYWLALWRQHLFPERAGAHRGAEHGLRPRQRCGAEDRNSLLPRLRLLGVLVRGMGPGPYRHRLWRVR